MGKFQLESAIGVVNGVNTVFFVSKPYAPNTTHVWVNGLLQRSDLVDGWLESNPTTGEITLKEAPRSIGHGLDIVQVAYIDTSADLPETSITEISGVISASEDINGFIFSEFSLLATLDEASTLEGFISESDNISGILDDSTITGSIELCLD